MPITKGFRQLVDEANAQITTYSVAQVRARLDDPTVQIVDIRDVRELEREGTVPGAIHAPRGMLEFWVDPASPYYKPVFGDEGREYVLFCGAGWRSALAADTLRSMGVLQRIALSFAAAAAFISASSRIALFRMSAPAKARELRYRAAALETRLVDPFWRDAAADLLRMPLAA